MTKWQKPATFLIPEVDHCIFPSYIDGKIIINKTYVKVVIAQNDTDFSCIKFDINVSKCFTKAQHFETLISRYRTNQCHSELLRLLHMFYLLFCTRHVRGHLNFHGIAIKLFDIVFMFVTSLSILWISSFHQPVSPLFTPHSNSRRCEHFPACKSFIHTIQSQQEMWTLPSL